MPLFFNIPTTSTAANASGGPVAAPASSAPTPAAAATANNTVTANTVTANDRPPRPGGSRPSTPVTGDTATPVTGGTSQPSRPGTPTGFQTANGTPLVPGGDGRTVTPAPSNNTDDEGVSHSRDNHTIDSSGVASPDQQPAEGGSPMLGNSEEPEQSTTTTTTIDGATGDGSSQSTSNQSQSQSGRQVTFDYGGISDEQIAALPLGSPTELDPAFQLPELAYAYDEKKPENNERQKCDTVKDIKKKLNEHQDLKEVLKTLAPQAYYEKELPKARNKIQSLSFACDKYKKAITRADGDPDFIHKSVKVDHKYDNPKNLLATGKYPQLVTMYGRLEEKEDALNKYYQKEGTKLVCHGNRISYFIHKNERGRILVQLLVDRLARGHITYYKKAHCREHSKDPTRPIKDKKLLCAKAVNEILQYCIDKEILKYLDLNRSALEKILQDEYGKPVNLWDLNPLDKLSVNHAVECMTRYIKIITVVHYNKVLEKATLKSADEDALAELEREDSAEKTSALEEHIKKTAKKMPTTPKELADLIILINKQTKAEEAKAAKKQALKRKNQEKNQNQSNPNDAGSKPPRKKPKTDAQTKAAASGSPPSTRPRKGQQNQEEQQQQHEESKGQETNYQEEHYICQTQTKAPQQHHQQQHQEHHNQTRRQRQRQRKRQKEWESKLVVPKISRRRVQRYTRRLQQQDTTSRKLFLG